VFSTPRVIPDSQAFTDDISTFVEEKEKPPPPSYLESISQSTQRSSQLVEAAVQTSPLLRETQLEDEEGEETFDLDLPQSSGRREGTPSPPERRVSRSPIRQGTPAASDRVGSDNEITSAISREDEPVDKEPSASLEEVDLNKEGTPELPQGPASQTEHSPKSPARSASPAPIQTEAEAQQLPPQDEPKAREVEIRPARARRRRSVNADFEDWFRREPNPKRRRLTTPTTPTTPELPSSSFPLPPDTILPYSHLDFPSPPPDMSDIPSSPSLPARPGSLREKMEARKQEMEQRLAASRSSSVASGTPGKEPAFQLPPVPQWTSQDAQVAVSPQTQEFDATVKTEGSTLAPQAKQGSQSSSPSSSSQFGSPNLETMEFVVVLPLSTETINDGSISQKEVYRQEILKKHAVVDDYLANCQNASEEVQESAFQLVRSAALIATHPHLVYPIAALSESDEREAEYHALMSAKFRFLKDLFAVIKEENLKIAIVAESPKVIVCYRVEAARIFTERFVQDMLEVFFRGIKIAHKRLDKLSERPAMSEDDIEGMATVFLVPSESRSGAVAVR
jgi:hypothetical protein